MKSVFWALVIASISSVAMANTCSISVSGGNDDKFGEFYRLKIKTDVKSSDKNKRPNTVIFSDIKADAELDLIAIKRKKGKLAYFDFGFTGRANKVMYFKFVSNVNLDMLPAGTYQAEATIEVICGS